MSRGGARKAPPLDVVLITHPRDEDDVPRLVPWAAGLSRAERTALVAMTRPVFGEIIDAGTWCAGILFLPVFAREIMDPATRGEARRMLADEALALAAEAGARIVCLGGLTGSLSNYGRRLAEPAKALGLSLTTGHSTTAISVFETYRRASRELGAPITGATLAVLGLGSVGAAFTSLAASHFERPRSITLVERPSRREHVEALAEALRTQGHDVRVELTNADGSLPAESACYRSRFVVSAVSSPNVIDIERVAPGTILVDDSQPYCWSRERAWARCRERRDIAPCEAGLIDCGAIGLRSHFPFDFADHGDEGSTTAWCCMTEGLIRAHVPSLPETIGEPTRETITAYHHELRRLGLTSAELQCGPNVLPIAELRASFTHPRAHQSGVNVASREYAA
ncbi:hypothetical protein L6R52_28590 [Myxococcota bacterium]|nr:hypothetical protein [Myxococcota bacterium]